METCRRNKQISKCLHSRTRVQQTQQSKLEVFAQPYPGTVVQAQVTDTDRTRVQQLQHSNFQVFAQPYPGTAGQTPGPYPGTAEATLTPGWKRRGPRTRLTPVMYIHHNKETTLCTIEKAAVWGRGPLSRVFLRCGLRGGCWEIIHAYFTAYSKPGCRHCDIWPEQVVSL